MLKEDVLKFWEIIKTSAINKKTIEETFNYQKTINNLFINTYFQNLDNEISLNNYKNEFKKFEKYINIIKESFSDTFEFSGGKQFRFFHSIHVAHNSNIIANELKISEEDKDIVVLASLFHDIGKSIKELKNIGTIGFSFYEEKFNLGRHEDISAEMTRKILENDFSEDFINNIVIAIKDLENNTLYENILHDADNIAEIGYMGIWRTFYYTNCVKQPIEQSIEYWFNKGYMNKKEKIQKLDIGKNIMNKKIELMNSFMNELKNLFEINI